MILNIVLLFVILSFVNVIFGTAKSIATINGNKFIASYMCGFYYAFYNIMIIYTVADFSLFLKCLITFVCNVVGVFVVKLIEEKAQKEKLWRIDFTINNVREDADSVRDYLEIKRIPHQYLDLGKHTVFTCYCENKQQSSVVKAVINKFNGKYFVSESVQL